MITLPSSDEESVSDRYMDVDPGIHYPDDPIEFQKPTDKPNLEQEKQMIERGERRNEDEK